MRDLFASMFVNVEFVDKLTNPSIIIRTIGPKDNTLVPKSKIKEKEKLLYSYYYIFPFIYIYYLFYLFFFLWPRE